MDSVVRPVLRAGSGGDGVVEDLLEGDPDGSGVFGDFFGCSAALVELREPIVLHRSTAGDEGLADDDLGVREFLFRLLEKFREAGLIAFDSAIIFSVQFMPDVIHADENAEDRGLKIDGVFFPTLLKVGHFMSADSAIENLEIKSGVAAENSAGCVEWVSLAECFGGVGLALLLFIPSSIRDGVTLEEDDVAFFK